MQEGLGKSSLYLLGSVVDIVRLRLAPGPETLSDEVGRHWLDLKFDDQPFFYDWSKLERFDVLALRRSLQSDFKVALAQDGSAKEFWYCLELGTQTKLFQPRKSNSFWQDPQTAPDLVFLSRSANLSAQDTAKIQKYRQAHPDTLVLGEQPLNMAILPVLDWVLLSCETRTQALELIKHHASVGRVFLRSSQGRWWLSDDKTTFEGETLANLSDEDWLKLILQIAELKLPLEDSAILLIEALRQIEAGKKANLAELNADDIDFAGLKVVAGQANFLRKLKQLRRSLEAKNQALFKLDDLRALQKDFGEQNYGQLMELIFQSPLAERASAILLDQSISASFDKIDLPSDIFLAIRADAGYEQLPGFANEKVTVGLDGLDKRLAMYRERGFDLATWRLWASLDEKLSDMAILSNSHMSARFAKICQNVGILPVIDLCLDGKDLIKLNRILKSLAQEMKLFAVDLSAVAVILPELSDVAEPDRQTFQIDPDAQPILFIAKSQDLGAKLSLLRQEFSSVVSLSRSLPLDEIASEIRSELEKISARFIKLKRNSPVELGL